jgi:hypothetical protein
MNQKERVIHRKLRIFQYADEIGHVAKACRYFGIASDLPLRISSKSN